MNILGIIPARYASTRFPGKPLVDINGKPMIQHVYEKVKRVLPNAVVATDNEEILSCVKSFGGNVIMTSKDHISGTSRCIEAYEAFQKNNPEQQIDIVINIQGDEPTLSPNQLNELADCFNDPKTEIATLIKETSSNKDVFNPNVVKVVYNKNNFAQYFSRSPIPYIRDYKQETWSENYKFYRHIGIYAFRSNVFLQLKKLENSTLEKAESLEQLNWLHHGYAIKLKETQYENIGIDTPQDLEELLKNGTL